MRPPPASSSSSSSSAPLLHIEEWLAGRLHGAIHQDNNVIPSGGGGFFGQNTCSYLIWAPLSFLLRSRGRWWAIKTIEKSPTLIIKLLANFCLHKTRRSRSRTMRRPKEKVAQGRRWRWVVVIGVSLNWPDSRVDGEKDDDREPAGVEP